MVKRKGKTYFSTKQENPALSKLREDHLEKMSSIDIDQTSADLSEEFVEYNKTNAELHDQDSIGNAISDELSSIPVDVTKNINAKYLVTTVDKLRLSINYYDTCKTNDFDILIKRHDFSGRSITYFYLLVTLIITLVTTDFNNVFFESGIWHGIYLTLIVVFVILMIKDYFFNFIPYKKKELLYPGFDLFMEDLHKR